MILDSEAYEEAQRACQLMKRLNSTHPATVAQRGETPRSRALPVSVAERDVVRAILDYCQAERIFVERRNVGAMKDKAGNFVKFNKRGMADLWGIKNGVHFECEVKRPGKVPSDNQFAWLSDCANAGARAFWADSLEQFIEGLRGL